MSSFGWAFLTAAAKAAIDASDARSRGTTSTDAAGTADSIVRRAASALSRLRAPMMTWAPLVASCSEAARPRPPLPPVTTAVLPD